MFKIRTIFFSVLIFLAAALGSYYAVMAKSSTSTSTSLVAANTCPAPSSFNLSNQDLWKILNGRYARRVNLPY